MFVLVAVASGSDSFSLEGEVEAANSRESTSVNMTPKLKYSESSDVDSGMINQHQPVMSRIQNGPFPVGSLPLGGDQLYSGQMISPTHPQGPVHFIPPQVCVHSDTQELSFQRYTHMYACTTCTSSE